MSIVFHPQNKNRVDLVTLKHKYTAEEVFDYREMLDAQQMMQEAVEADAEHEAKQQQRRG